MATIPRALHFIWLHLYPPLPEKAAFNIDTWRALNPDMTVQIHDSKDVDLAAETLSDNVKGVFFSKSTIEYEVAALVMLYTHGGIALGLDMQGLKSLSPLLNENPLFVAVQDKRVKGLNADEEAPSLDVIGAPAGHPAIKRVLDKVTSTTTLKQLQRAWTAAFTEFKLASMSTPQQVFLLPPELFGFQCTSPCDSCLMATNQDAYGFSTALPPNEAGTQPLQRAYHAAIHGIRYNRRIIAFVSAVIVLVILIITLCICAVLVARNNA